MSKQPLIQFLRSSNLVSLQTADEIADTFAERSLLRNEFLLREGKVCDEYFFLAKGFMRAFAHDTEGNDVTTNFYRDLQVVFEVSSFFNRTKSKENIQAIKQDKPKKKFSRFEKYGIRYIDYKDVEFLKKFINEQGKILPRRLSGNSLKYQRKVADAIKKARQMALLPYVTDLLK